jgi:hypothetical protein
MARTYKRDSRGRFASGGSARSTPKTRVVTGARAVSGGKNRLTRDNAGRITSVGGQGATARGGRLRTASGAKRGAVIVRMNSTGGKLRKPIGGGAPRISRAEPLATGGTLAARSSLTRARRKLEQNATPAQRGAVTRAKKYAAQSYDKNTQPRKFGRPASVMRKRPPESPLRWQVEGGKALVATGRTRKQAAAAQRERGRRLYEFARSAPDVRPPRSGSLRRKKLVVPQGNLLTGRLDKMVVKSKNIPGPSRIGASATARKTAVRRSRAEVRYEALLQEKRNVRGKGRTRNRELARINQRLATVAGAFETYDMGTGRRIPRRSTARR